MQPAASFANPFTRPAFEDPAEARLVLSDLARRRTGRIPPERIAEHVLAITDGADFTVRRAALEALLRRRAAAEREQLRIAERPKGGVFGEYSTRRPGSEARPYRTVLRSLQPIEGSCDCPDFLRGSLGICKHLVVVLDEVFARGARVAPPANGATRLGWSCVRPLVGAGDWMERVELHVADGDRIPPRLKGRFEPVGDGTARLRQPHDDDAKRLEIVRDLEAHAGRGGNADPALAALARLERARLEQRVANRDLVRRLPSLLRSLKVKLFAYQREGVERIVGAGRLLLADDMGLGKTAQAVATCHALWEAGVVRRGLVVAPASLKPQWRREWQSFTDVPVTLVDGGPEERAKLYRTKSGFLLVNYELVVRDLPLLQAWKPDLTVLDEAQRIKNWATKTALSVKRLSPRWRVVLTGTPMENRLDELASILEWVDDLALEPKWRLAPLHSVTMDGRAGIAGARHLDTLRTRLSGCMVRRRRTEVLDQLPARTDTRVPAALTEAQRERHDELNMPIASLAARGRRRPLTQAEFLKLMTLLATQRMISNGLALVDFEEMWPSLERVRAPSESLLTSLSSPKLVELRALTETFAEEERKVVVFSQWRRMLDLAHWAVSDVLKRAGQRAVFFTGRESPQRRTQNIVDFHDDPRTLILFATDAGGVGLNLQRAANCCVNLELPWNPAVLEQRIGRIHRLGQSRPISVYNLVSEQGIEARISDLVADKKALFSGLFDGTTDEVHFDSAGSFLSRVERIVEKPEVVESAPESEEADPDAPPEAAEVVPEVVSAPEQAEAAPPTVTEAVPEVASAPAAAGTETAGPLPAEAPQSGEVAPVPVPGESPARAVAAATPGSAPEAPASPVAIAAMPGDFLNLFAQIRVRPAADGGIAIEAPREAASALATLLGGLAAKLAEAGR